MQRYWSLRLADDFFTGGERSWPWLLAEGVMKTWQEDLLSIVDHATRGEEIFPRIESAAKALGFEFCAYGFRAPLPVSNPRVVMLNNYPQVWRDRYAQAGYLRTDPTVLHARRSRTPLVWNDSVFAGTAALWEEAQSVGLRVGWAQSSLDGVGVGGMLTLARSYEPLTANELEANQDKMRWLVHVSHMSLGHTIKTKDSEAASPALTTREVEVLRWTADGKSSQDIADILTLSRNTVEFHVKNAVMKLRAANKTAAVVRAALLGFLV
jgi:LuxR family transcriptional regulator